MARVAQESEWRRVDDDGPIHERVLLPDLPHRPQKRQRVFGRAPIGTPLDSCALLPRRAPSKAFLVGTNEWPQPRTARGPSRAEPDAKQRTGCRARGSGRWTQPESTTEVQARCHGPDAPQKRCTARTLRAPTFSALLDAATSFEARAAGAFSGGAHAFGGGREAAAQPGRGGGDSKTRLLSGRRRNLTRTARVHAVDECQ